MRVRQRSWLILGGLACVLIMLQRPFASATTATTPSHPARWQYAEIQYFTSQIMIELSQDTFFAGGTHHQLIAQFDGHRYRVGSAASYGAAFTRMGATGWEMVGVATEAEPYGTIVHYLFKRPLPQRNTPGS